jgi:sec-independent protein translocase protein TatB
MPDILFILLLAMIVLGPKKLPQVAAQIGKYLAQFQRMKREVIDQVNGEMLRLEKHKTSDDEADGGDASPMPAIAGVGSPSLESHT